MVDESMMSTDFLLPSLSPKIRSRQQSIFPNNAGGVLDSIDPTDGLGYLAASNRQKPGASHNDMQIVLTGGLGAESKESGEMEQLIGSRQSQMSPKLSTSGLIQDDLTSGATTSMDHSNRTSAEIYSYVPPTDMQEEDDEGSTLTCWQKLRFFIKMSCKDISRHKCQFCLSFCSVFVVVLSILLVQTIVRLGPIIFMRLSEKTVGEYDAIISSREGTVEDFNAWSDSDNGYFVDYAKATTQLADASIEANLAPRLQFCDNIVHYQLSGHAAESTSAGCLGFLDTQKEKDINLGVTYPFDALKAGECLAPSALQKIGLTVNSKLTIELVMGKLLKAIAADYNTKTNPSEKFKAVYVPKDTTVFFECTIVGFLDEAYGKYGKDGSDGQMLMEYNQLFPYIIPQLPWTLTSNPKFVTWIREPNILEHYASMMMFTMPGSRLSAYETSDVAHMRKNIYNEVNKVTNAIGFYPTSVVTKLLNDMAGYNFAILFIGLVFNILIILYIAISILLIYSLLMITTETKTFDFGIMRLVGLSSRSFVVMIFTQGVMFVLPSILTAYICSIPILFLLLQKILSTDLTQGEMSVLPTGVATVEGIGIGLLIPTLSAIIPIQRALAKSLDDSLNTARATLSGTTVIIDDKSVKVVPYLLAGLLCVSMGTIIYVVLPQALLAENAALILEIFFAILIGMILGLTLLSANLRKPLETLMVYVLFFWERKSMRALLKKNLIAHKRTNKLTSIIYALSLGCIIFLIVALHLEIQTIQALFVLPNTDIYVEWENWVKTKEERMYAQDFDPILLKYNDQIKSFGLMSSGSICQTMNQEFSINHSDATTKQHVKSAYIYAMNPSSYWDQTFKTDWTTDTTNLGLTEQFYTARGSQGQAIDKNYAKRLLVDPSNYSEYFTVGMSWYHGTQVIPDQKAQAKAKYPLYGKFAIPMRPLWTATEKSQFIHVNGKSSWGLMQIPNYTYINNLTVDELTYFSLSIQMKNPDDHTTIDMIAAELEAALGSKTTTTTAADSAGTVDKITSIMNKVFYGLISITMFLCFFSLSASMSANLYEQKKEVGVLRAMGFTKYRVRMLYFYESLIVVTTSCTMGVLIGTIVGYTMLMQFNLFLQVKSVGTFFPWVEFLLVLGLSIICAFLSTWGPATQLTNRSVAGIFRLV